MDLWKRLFRDAERREAGDRLWERIERSRLSQAEPVRDEEGAPSHPLLRWGIAGGGFAAVAAVVVVMLLPGQNSSMSREEWTVLANDLFGERGMVWEKESSFGEELTDTFIALLDEEKGE